jgi:hypothetical protein
MSELEKNPHLASIEEELDHLRLFTQAGLYEFITPEFFPFLSQNAPDYLTLQVMDSLGNRTSTLYRAFRNAPTSEEKESILSQMNLANDRWKSFNFVETSESNAIHNLAWMNDQEREGLKMMIWIGDIDAINIENYPSLVGVDPEIVNEIRAEALKSRKVRIVDILLSRKQAMGLLSISTKDSLTVELENRLKDLLVDENQLLRNATF